MYAYYITYAGPNNHKYMKPPKQQAGTVSRQKLLDEMADKICNVALNVECYETTLTVTGAGGFGKTTLVTALCHHPVIKEQFTDGFIFVELGPQASDPSNKLNQLYHLLTGKKLNPGNTNYAEQEILQVVAECYQNLLVIIDDVWHIEDAEPIVRAFGHCKTVLTTRMNDIDQYISTKEKISIGPMELDDAFALLTNGVIDCSELSQEDKSLLDELAQEAHLWPLILSLIRGQLFHNVKRFRMSCHDAIQKVKRKLHDKGLTAFDKNNIDNTERSRKFAVKVCIEITLELLSESESKNFKSLVLTTGVGNFLPSSVLHNLWNVSEEEAQDRVSKLWAYGIVKFTDNILPPNNKIQHCVEVHAVISQYIIESIECEQVFKLSPRGLGTLAQLKSGLEHSFLKSYGVNNISSLTPTEFLKYTQSKIECDLLPWYIQEIDSRRIFELHFIVSEMEKVQFALRFSPNTHHVLPSFNEQFSVVEADCSKMLKNLHRVSRELTQIIQRHLNNRNYNKLMQGVENNCFKSPIGQSAKQCVAVIKDVIPYCDSEQADVIVKCCVYLQKMTPDYSMITYRIFPYIKLHIELHQKITSALQNGSPDIERTYHYCNRGEYQEKFDLVHNNYLNRLQGVAASLLN